MFGKEISELIYEMVEKGKGVSISNDEYNKLREELIEEIKSLEWEEVVEELNDMFYR